MTEKLDHVLHEPTMAAANRAAVPIVAIPNGVSGQYQGRIKFPVTGKFSTGNAPITNKS